VEVQFATCERHSALKYLQHVYPSKVVTDTPDCAGPLLDLVARDVMRVQDPHMYGNRIAIVPGNKFDESQRDECTRICQGLVAKLSEAQS
jgi:hypothetical protein